MLEQATRGSVFVVTVEDNKKMFSKRQVEGATAARNTYEALLCPSVEDFNSIIKMGGIKGCKLTADDVKISFKIFGLSVPKDKGKDTPTRWIGVTLTLWATLDAVGLGILTLQPQK